MHMADALLSPAVGGTAWAAAAGLIGISSRKLRDGLDDHRVPLMGVMGAFIFAAQMVNFTIPATGSSGHLGGGLVLAILLGPAAAFLTLASVLTVQALFFADGGLLALGCNILNLGFFPCFVAYPFIYRKITANRPGKGALTLGALLAGVAGLQLGSLAVVLETTLSGISELPFDSFLLLMQPVHLAIGIVEGFATAAVVLFVARSRPEVLENNPPGAASRRALRRTAAAFLVSAVLLGGAVSWFASGKPDGLEWSILKTTGREELAPSDDRVSSSLEQLQSRTAVLPDYGFGREEPEGEPARNPSPWPAPDPGTSLSGLIGGVLTLLLAGGGGLLLRRRGKKAAGH